ncbi:MAG: adenylate kinase [Tenericutes bacterium]|nr:adenylate kinase [Mycoplasmatota bacterium]
MIILISGATHTGKTLIAQKLLEKYKYPYLSIDHLKMGLIRSGNTELMPDSTFNQLTKYLWPIIREIIKTNIENHQHLIIEGCYIPHNYKKDFTEFELSHINMVSIVFSSTYIDNNYQNIIYYSSVIESRLYDEVNKKRLIKENFNNLVECNKHHIRIIYIEEKYDIDLIVKEISGLLSFSFYK